MKSKFDEGKSLQTTRKFTIDRNYLSFLLVRRRFWFYSSSFFSRLLLLLLLFCFCSSISMSQRHPSFDEQNTVGTKIIFFKGY